MTSICEQLQRAIDEGAGDLALETKAAIEELITALEGCRAQLATCIPSDGRQSAIDIADRLLAKHGCRMSTVNYAAWFRNAAQFLRERGLEQEFGDWCGGWPLPTALATGSRRAKTPKAVECEASQSGPKGNVQTRPGTPQ